MTKWLVLGIISGSGILIYLVYRGIKNLYNKGRKDERREVELAAEKQINKHMQKSMEKVIKIDGTLSRVKHALRMRPQRKSKESKIS